MKMGKRTAQRQCQPGKEMRRRVAVSQISQWEFFLWGERWRETAAD